MNLKEMFQTDPKLETDGIYLEYGETNDDPPKPIRFKVARAGGANQAFAKMLDIRTKPYRRLIQSEMLEVKIAEKIFREVYSHTVVLGWENVRDDNDQDIEFSPQAAIDLFIKLPELFADIREQCQKGVLFRQAVMEESAKNS